MNAIRQHATAAMLLALVLWSCAAPLHAQSYPSRQVRFIVPFPPGGVTDRMARLLSQRMTESWLQPVVVENRPGGSGIIACQAVTAAPPDGYTLLMGNINTHAINASLLPKLPYDPVRDFAPISLLVSVPNLLVVHPSVPANSFQDLVALARSRPGTLNFASSGAGTSSHLAGELFRTMAKIDIVHVPYKGPGPALQDLLAGQVSMTFDTVSSTLPQVRAGKLKGLAVTSPGRAAVAPDIPTVAESGLPGFDVAPWFGALARAGTPAEVIAKLNAEMVRILGLPDIRDNLVNVQGMTVIAGTPEAFARHIEQETARWARIVRETGAKPD